MKQAVSIVPASRLSKLIKKEKENENIHLHIIESTYSDLKKSQEQSDASGKAVLSEELREASILKALETIHDGASFTEPKWLETAQENPENKQKTDESLNGLTVAELFSSLQNMKAEEQKLQDRKQLLLGDLDKLKLSIIEEIDKKQKSIKCLKSEVLELEKTHKEISQRIRPSANST